MQSSKGNRAKREKIVSRTSFLSFNKTVSRTMGRGQLNPFYALDKSKTRFELPHSLDFLSTKVISSHKKANTNSFASFSVSAINRQVYYSSISLIMMDFVSSSQEFQPHLSNQLCSEIQPEKFLSNKQLSQASCFIYIQMNALYSRWPTEFMQKTMI